MSPLSTTTSSGSPVIAEMATCSASPVPRGGVLDDPVDRLAEDLAGGLAGG